MGNKRGSTLKVGDRVKLSALAFQNGVYERTRATLAKRGEIMSQGRNDPDLFNVQWDDRKTPERLHREFLLRATTGAPR